MYVCMDVCMKARVCLHVYVYVITTCPDPPHLLVVAVDSIPLAPRQRYHQILVTTAAPLLMHE